MAAVESNGTQKPSSSGLGQILIQALNVAAMIAMAALIWASLLYAKPALNLAGDEQLTQRIFYIHMGCNFGALTAFFVSLFGSIAYLVTRNLRWDRITQAAVEAGVIIGSGTIITGIFWAKPTWNTYWTWDPRLTTATITVLLYVAYMLFRNGIDNRESKALVGSIYALFAFLSLPLTYFSARWFRSIHPVVFSGDNPEAEGGFVLGTTMTQTLVIAAVAFLLLFTTLVIQRYRLLQMDDTLAEIREELY